MPEARNDMDEPVHRTVEAVKVRPKWLDPALILRVGVVAIEAPCDKIGGLYETARPRVCKQGHVREVRELSDSTGYMTPRIHPALSVLLDHAPIMNDDSLLVDAGNTSLSS